MQRLLICGMCALVGIAPAAAQAPTASRPVNTAIRTAPPRILAGTPATAFGTIDGSTVDSASNPLSESLMRLRDARFGRIVVSQWTDKGGRFTFGGVDPGSYVVELVGRAQAVLATSHMATIDGGQTVSVIVRLPSRVSPVAGLFGTNARALAITSAAAAVGVLTTVVARDDASPE